MSFFFLIFGLMVCFSSPLPAQILTIVRKVKSMHSDDGNKDVATVILDAGASNVYRAAMDTLQAVPKIRITKTEKNRRYVEFSNETNSISIQVDSMAVQLSQITVLATHGGNSTKKASDMAVNTILGICHKAGIKCTVTTP